MVAVSSVQTKNKTSSVERFLNNHFALRIEIANCRMFYATELRVMSMLLGIETI